MSPASTTRADATTEVGELARRGDVMGLVAIIRACAKTNRRIFAEPEVKAWCARRWRHLFLREAVEDPVALEFASRRLDRRSPRQRIAECFLAEGAHAAWQDEQPDPVERRLTATTLVVCPGFLNGYLPAREFLNDLPQIEWRYGIRMLRSASHPVRGCEANVADILSAIEQGKGTDAHAAPIASADERPPGDVMALGYSKGAPDLLTALALHPHLKQRVKCVVTWAGAIGGSPVADDLAAKFRATGFENDTTAIGVWLKKFAYGRMSVETFSRRRIEEFDAVSAVRDLTTSVRQAFLVAHASAIDNLDIPIFTFRGVTHLNKVPLSQRGGFRKLAKFESQNDMQVAASGSQLLIPMATELAVLRGHHWDIAHPPFRRRRWLNNCHHPFPKTAAIAAIVQLAAELGLIE